MSENVTPGWVKQADDDPDDRLTSSELKELKKLAGQAEPDVWVPKLPG